MTSVPAWMMPVLIQRTVDSIGHAATAKRDESAQRTQSNHRWPAFTLPSGACLLSIEPVGQRQADRRHPAKNLAPISTRRSLIASSKWMDSARPCDYCTTWQRLLVDGTDRRPWFKLCRRAISFIHSLFSERSRLNCINQRTNKMLTYSTLQLRINQNRSVS